MSTNEYEKQIARGRPRKVEDASNVTLHIMVGRRMLNWIEEEFHRRRVPTRADAVRAIIQDAMDASERLREMGEAAE